MFRNSTRVFVEDLIWGDKERKYIANYGMKPQIESANMLQLERNFMTIPMGFERRKTILVILTEEVWE